MAQQYTIKSGDTLFNLAQQFYGDGGLWGKIVNANTGLDANNLQVGKTITIPD